MNSAKEIVQVDMKKEFEVLSINRELLIQMGFDSDTLTDDVMEKIAGGLADLYLQSINDDIDAILEDDSE